MEKKLDLDEIAKVWLENYDMPNVLFNRKKEGILGIPFIILYRENYNSQPQFNQRAQHILISNLIDQQLHNIVILIVRNHICKIQIFRGDYYDEFNDHSLEWNKIEEECKNQQSDDYDGENTDDENIEYTEVFGGYEVEVDDLNQILYIKVI